MVLDFVSVRNLLVVTPTLIQKRNLLEGYWGLRELTGDWELWLRNINRDLLGGGVWSVLQLIRACLRLAQDPVLLQGASYWSGLGHLPTSR